MRGSYDLYQSTEGKGKNPIFNHRRERYFLPLLGALCLEEVAEHRAPGGAMKPAKQPFRARPSGDGEARGGIILSSRGSAEWLCNYPMPLIEAWQSI